MLWEEGDFSPFEILSSYPLPQGTPTDLWRTRISIVSKGTTEKSSSQPVSFRVRPEESRFEATVSDDVRGDLRNLYPFLQQPFVVPPDNRLYGPFREKIEGDFDREILLQVLYPVTGYYLETDLIPGSVQVMRNGKDESRFSVDYESGRLTFQTTITPTDRIEVTYKKRGALLNNGDLLFAWGNRFQLNPNVQLELAAGFRWNFLPGAYSEKAYSRTGVVLGSSSLKGKFDHLSYTISGGLSYTLPDTTGILRLMGMEKTGLDIELSEDLAYPSSAPEEPISGFSATKLNRGELFYKDYRQYGLLGESDLQYSDWHPPDEQIFPYESGSKPGPYTVADTNSPEVNHSLVMDFKLDSGEWVGIQMPALPGQGVVDLSSLKAVLLSYRTIDFSGSGSFDVYLQIGEIDEDLDGDSILDKETSATSSGFLFNDQANGANLYVGGGPRMEGNYKVDTEDIDGNDFLDGEVADRVLTIPIASNIGDITSWEAIKSYFSEIDPDFKKILSRTRAIRIIIANPSLDGCEGRFLLNRLTLAGTTFGITEDNSSVGTKALETREIRESASKLPPPETLDRAYPSVGEIFHSHGEIQKVLEVFWADYDNPGDSWKIRGFTETGTEGIHYNELVYYLRTPKLTPVAGGSPSLTFTLLDAENKGISWSFQPSESPAWKEVTLNIKNKQLTVGNQSIEAEVTVDRSFGSLSRLEVHMEDYSDGTLYLDELHAKKPDGAFGGALAAESTMSWPGTNLAWGTIPVISDLTIDETLHLISPGFSPFYGRPAVSWDSYSQTSVSLGFFFIQLGIDMEVQGIDTEFLLSGGHRMDIPRGSPPIQFSDSYYLQEKPEGAEFNRRNAIEVRFSDSARGGIDSEAFSQENLLIQSWEGSLSLPPPGWSSLGLSTSFSKTSTEYTHEESDYFSSWILGYRYLVPRTEGSDLERSTDLDLSLGILPNPLGVEVNLNASYKSMNIHDSQRDQSDHLNYSLFLPITLSEKLGLSFKPGYQRTWDGTVEESEPGSVLMDLGRMGYRFSTQPYLINQLPVYEFYSDRTEDDFILYSSELYSSHYTPRFSFDLSRRIQSHWSSLLLPSQVEFGFGKSFEKSADLYQFLNSYDFTYRTSAINLFGQFGAYPLFPFYTIDEISNGFTANLLYSRGGVRERDSYRIESYFSFEGAGGNLLTLTNYVNIVREREVDLSTDTKISFNWFVYPERGVSLPLIGEEIAKTGFISHLESLSLILHNLQKDLAVHPVTLVIRHETALRFPEHGYIRAEIGLGFDMESYSIIPESWNIYRFGLTGIIEGKIQF
ncbi:MAG TPA: hypothetical protein VMX75_02655 [Spirochaetia bacterium]|nr:hypothetical protein [Spirochaetia bacterium]